MSFLWLQNGQIWSCRLRANINNTLRAFSRRRVSLEYIFLAGDFSFLPYFARPIPRLLSPLIVSLPLYSSYSSMFRLLPYLWTYFTLLSLVHSRSTLVIYIFFALRPLMYRRFIGLSIMNGMCNVSSIYLK